MNSTIGQTVHIVIASENPVKAGAIEGAFQKLFPATSYQLTQASVDSGVSDQPLSDDETKQGALNRVAAARRIHPGATVWVGLEGGVERDEQRVLAFAWIVVESSGRRSAVRTATFPLPDRIVELIDQGVELGHANDQVFGRENSKQREGAVGTLTGGLIDRRELYEHAAIMALAPWKNPVLFPES